MSTNGGQLISKFNGDPRFIGIYSSDNPPPIGKFILGTAMIFNLDVTGGPGTHWTCAIYPPSGKLYIDPLSLDAPKLISKFLSPYHYSDTEYQPLRSQNCGKYCIYFIFNFLHGLPFDHGLDKFPSTRNDFLVDRFFNIM